MLILRAELRVDPGLVDPIDQHDVDDLNQSVNTSIDNDYSTHHEYDPSSPQATRDDGELGVGNVFMWLFDFVFTPLSVQLQKRKASQWQHLPVLKQTNQSPGASAQ